ncbi:MAG: type II secretion system GspH family protein [Lentisphaeraceae bacterium]|nr:type II secretion system GspH family protein [Lentisphaeraceae bacterium]
MKTKFTLIELLVAIAIIGILVSILMPSISSAREKARIAVELSNRKQLYSATIMYMRDGDDRFPYRGSNVTWLHTIGQNSNYDLNKTLVNPYLGTGKEIRSEIMFCDSTLFDVRNPDDFNGYDNRHCTLNYYVIPNTGNLVKPGFSNERLSNSKSSNPLWSCMVLYKSSSNTWLGHNAPASSRKTDGASTVFVGGDAKWVRESSYEILWVAGNGFEFYEPVQ